MGDDKIVLDSENVSVQLYGLWAGPQPGLQGMEFESPC